MATRMLGRAFGDMGAIIKEHTCIKPLLFAMAFSGTTGTFTMIYTSLRKSDVEYNRFKTIQPSEALRRGRNMGEKLIIFDRDAYTENTTSLQHLLDEIYIDGRYPKGGRVGY